MVKVEGAKHEPELKALMRMVFILDVTIDGVLGKGAHAMMYQSGRDTGRVQGRLAARTEDFDTALRSVLAEGEGVWRFEYWKDPGQQDHWIHGGDRSSAWLVFRSCPLQRLTRAVGTKPGGLLCHAFHGYMIGCMEMALGRRVDMKIGHCGPRACKVQVEMRK